MALHRRLRKMRNVRVGDGDRFLDPLRERAQAGAQHDSHPRRNRDALANRSSGLFRSFKNAVCLGHSPPENLNCLTESL